MVKVAKMAEVADAAAKNAEDRLVSILVPMPGRERNFNPLEVFFGPRRVDETSESAEAAQREEIRRQREAVRERLRRGELDSHQVEIEVEDNTPPMLEVFTGSGMEEMGINLQDMFGNLFPKRVKRRKVNIREALRLRSRRKLSRSTWMKHIRSRSKAENDGIIFLDETQNRV